MKRVGRRASRGAARGLAAVVGLLAALGSGCGGEPPRPVARLAVSPAEVVLPYPQSATLSARWETTGPLSGRSDDSAGAGGVRVFVHLLDASGAVVRTFDHALPFAWHSGETRESPLDLWQSALAEPLPPGDYRLTLGLYDPEDGHRWTLETDALVVDEGEYAVARVEVPPAAPAPGLAFEGSWWPAEAGADRQVLARRWLRQEGSLVLSGLAGAARVALSLRIPEPGDGDRLLLHEGAARARVRVTSPCASAGEVVDGAGDHDVVLDLLPADDGRCAVRFEPTFSVIDLSSLTDRSAALERVTVTPAGR